jgi:aminocarboxymuconate-semialdehyde decarboxylase
MQETYFRPRGKLRNSRFGICSTLSILEFVIREVGAERVMIGSDYCFDMGVERPRELLEQINLLGSQRKMILGDNAARLLKL